MYLFLLTLHSLFRWVVLGLLLYSIVRATTGFFSGKAFSRTDENFQNWTVSAANFQGLLGIVLYIISPFVRYFWAGLKTSFQDIGLTFFGIIHIGLMLVAIAILTNGAVLTKRKQSDLEKFKTMLNWFLVALLVIFLAIPWPFSPLSHRPLIRTF